MNQNKYNERGFSLVELSIVLVIIGLITGGILGGVSMIRAAEMQSVITDLEKYQKSIGYFQDKYHALPGDYSLATTEWAAASGAGNGNQSLADGAEIYLAWQHLSLAEMVAGSFSGAAGASGGLADSGINVPRIKIGSQGGVSFAALGYVAAASTEWYEGIYKNPLIVYDMPAGADDETSIKPVEQWNIDRKIDDGLPQTGNVRAKENQANCVDGTNYNLDESAGSCALIYITGF